MARAGVPRSGLNEGKHRDMSSPTPKAQPAPRGRLPFGSVMMIGAAWLMFAMVAVFYSMLPLILLPGLPFLFLGVVSLVTAVTQEAEKTRR